MFKVQPTHSQKKNNTSTSYFIFIWYLLPTVVFNHQKLSYETLQSHTLSVKGGSYRRIAVNKNIKKHISVIQFQKWNSDSVDSVTMLIKSNITFDTSGWQLIKPQSLWKLKYYVEPKKLIFTAERLLIENHASMQSSTEAASLSGSSHLAYVGVSHLLNNSPQIAYDRVLLVNEINLFNGKHDGL